MANINLKIKFTSDRINTKYSFDSLKELVESEVHNVLVILDVFSKFKHGVYKLDELNKVYVFKNMVKLDYFPHYDMVVKNIQIDDDEMGYTASFNNHNDLMFNGIMNKVTEKLKELGVKTDKKGRFFKKTDSTNVYLNDKCSKFFDKFFGNGQDRFGNHIIGIEDGVKLFPSLYSDMYFTKIDDAVKYEIKLAEKEFADTKKMMKDGASSSDVSHIELHVDEDTHTIDLEVLTFLHYYNSNLNEIGNEADGDFDIYNQIDEKMRKEIYAKFVDAMISKGYDYFENEHGSIVLCDSY